jgi:predicted ester cyclase
VNSDDQLIAFVGDRRITSGLITDVITHLKARFDRAEPDALIFDQRTGAQVDFDLRGPLADVLARAVPAEPRGRGRPKLGVAGREVSLLPRHWDWLEQQHTGASAAIRRLVEQASKTDPGREQARRIRAALSRFLSAMAGNREQYEEATRALFAGQDDRFDALTATWPTDIRAFALQQAREATRQERTSAAGSNANVTLIRDLYERVWTFGDYSAIDSLVALKYTIHLDPGDAWEGQTLDHAGYRERVRHSRQAFPDLVFTIDDTVAAGDKVAVRWRAEGTHEGDLTGIPATGKRVAFGGQTIYAVCDGRVSGHWQVVDRLGFYQQVRSSR